MRYGPGDAIKSGTPRATRDKERPMKSILDPEFRYTPSVETDLRKTFARVRREQRRQHEAFTLAEAEARKKVLPIVPRRQEA